MCLLYAGPGPDPTYSRIFDGAWACALPYGVIHRVASDGTQKGVLAQCVAFAAERYSHLRIDTHEKNIPMQRALAKEGFTHRGTIITGDGTPASPTIGSPENKFRFVGQFQKRRHPERRRSRSRRIL